ncbi:cell division protein FtsQ/DivIB [Pontibacter sp. JAM-7]|uniref:cell division protein FtsQ/DivIB n=1 Tax=Pontibacter sp. JAM-7 TaxID=3366581 RepID=UPI003AF8DB97
MQQHANKTPQPVSVSGSETESWWYVFSRVSVLLLFVGLLSGLTAKFWHWLDRPVAEVRLYGETRHLNRNELARTIAGGVQQSLLQVDIDVIRQQVKDQPWVHIAAIRRDWPETLAVEVEEEVPVARWSEHGLLNHQGDIFWPQLQQEYLELPRLSGPAPETSRVMAQFHDLNQVFRPLGLQVVGLNLEPRGAWSLELDNNIRVIVGRENIEQRLQRFLRVYELGLSERAAQIEQIDIRYTNGVAVKWRDVTAPEATAG